MTGFPRVHWWHPDTCSLVSCLRNKLSVSDAAFDLFSGLGPDKGFSVFIPVFQEPVNGTFQLGHRIKAAPADGLLADNGKPALDQV